jgi:hypothetical protein
MSVHSVPTTATPVVVLVRATISLTPVLKEPWPVALGGGCAANTTGTERVLAVTRHADGNFAGLGRGCLRSRDWVATPDWYHLDREGGLNHDPTCSTRFSVSAIQEQP